MTQQVHARLLQEHEVLFLDFLGFATAVERWDDAQMEELIAVLADLANVQSNFDIEGQPQSDGSYKITSRAEITTFSDHILVSYPRLPKPPEIADYLKWLIMAGREWSASRCSKSLPNSRWRLSVLECW
jgi:hypothetical protein